MTSRERFWRTMRFEPVDGLPNWADWLGPWETWRKQGLPLPPEADQEGFDARQWFIDHFGFDGMYSIFWGQPRVPVETGVWPLFEKEFYEKNETYSVFRGGNGVIVKQFTHPGSSLISTEFLEYPIKNRRDWERFRDDRLDPDAPGRYPEPAHWETLKQEWENRDYVISIDGGSFYGFLRDWIGVENLSYMVYDDPELVREMMDTLGDLFRRVLRKAVEEVSDIDFAMFWEDMCYKTGPLLSPAMFREWMVPNYRKVTSFLENHEVRLSWVDCDGNIEALIPLWLEGGVRGFYPLEVAAGMDAGRLRRQYGRDIVMWGNVDKRALAAGKESIDAELARLAPVAAQGGFIPLVDHGVPDDVSYQNYLYYLEQRRKVFTGIR